VECGQFGLDRSFLANQPGCRRVEGCDEGIGIPCGRAKRWQQLLDHRTAEAGLEQLLNLRDECQMLR